MNYGSGEVQDYYRMTSGKSFACPALPLEDADEYPGDIWDTYASNDATGIHCSVEEKRNYVAQMQWPDITTREYVNVYGFNKRAPFKKSKNFFHSLPYSYFQSGVKWSAFEGNNTNPIKPDDGAIFGNETEYFKDYSRPLVPGSFGSGYKEAPYQSAVTMIDAQNIEGLQDPAITAYKYRVHKHSYVQNSEQRAFFHVNSLMREHLGGADAFNKEVFKHSQYGNIFNGKLGNVTLQPYVRIVDYTSDEIIQNAGKYTANLYRPTENSGLQQEPCDDAFEIVQTSFEDYAAGFFAALNKGRDEDNVFTSYIYDYIPLPVWSHFYTETFLRLLNVYEAPEDAEVESDTPPETGPMKIIYDKYGLEPFFKEVKFGLRLSYSTTFPFDEDIDIARGYTESGAESTKVYNLKEFMQASFGRGKSRAAGAKEVPAWGLKSSKTLFGHRPYYAGHYTPGEDQTNPAAPPGPVGEGSNRSPDHERYKICDEIQIPIVEVEREIVTVPETSPISFKIDDNDTLIPLSQLGHFDNSIHEIFKAELIELLKFGEGTGEESPAQEGKYSPQSPQGAPPEADTGQSDQDKGAKHGEEELYGKEITVKPNLDSNECKEYEWALRAYKKHKAAFIVKAINFDLKVYSSWSVTDADIEATGAQEAAKAEPWEITDPEVLWKFYLNRLYNITNAPKLQVGAYNVVDYSDWHEAFSDSSNMKKQDLIAAKPEKEKIWSQAAGSMAPGGSGPGSKAGKGTPGFLLWSAGDGDLLAGMVWQLDASNNPDSLPKPGTKLHNRKQDRCGPITWIIKGMNEDNSRVRYDLINHRYEWKKNKLVHAGSPVVGVDSGDTNKIRRYVDCNYLGISAGNQDVDDVSTFVDDTAPPVNWNVDHVPSDYVRWSYNPTGASVHDTCWYIPSWFWDDQDIALPFPWWVNSQGDTYYYNSSRYNELPEGHSWAARERAATTPENGWGWDQPSSELGHLASEDTDGNNYDGQQEVQYVMAILMRNNNSWPGVHASLDPTKQSYRFWNPEDSNPCDKGTYTYMYGEADPGPPNTDGDNPESTAADLINHLMQQNTNILLTEDGILQVQGQLWAKQAAQLVDINSGGVSRMKHLCNNFHQFFYKNLAKNMLNDLKNTPEWKLMYEHLFPMRRYMALSFAYAGDSMSRFIPDPTDLLDVTKSTLLQVMTSIENSLDYTFLPDPLASFLTDQLDVNETSTQGRQPNLAKIILWIIIRTSLLILKGFVEVTDPAIIIAKFIIDTINAIQQAVIALIESGINTAKAVINAARDAAASAIKMIEINLSILASTVQITVESILSMIPLPNPESTTQPPEFLKDASGENITLDSYVTFEVMSGSEALEIDAWTIEIEPLADEIYNSLKPNHRSAWDDMKTEIEKAGNLQQDYMSAKKKLESLEETLETVIADLEDALADAKKTMKEIFASPFLLPGLWAAMIPSMIPYGGGLMPPPLPGGPPSTVPGMIYLALLFLDGWEDTMARQTEQEDDDFNCEDVL
jgi:hypothetical protein